MIIKNRLVGDIFTLNSSYSVRQLKSTATQCIRVRRSSDNTESDIGFKNGVLDEDALLSFCGSGNGFIRTWYDQINTRHLLQTTTTAQPQIVFSGTVNRTNNLPSIDFNGTTHYLFNNSPFLYNAVNFNTLLAGSFAGCPGDAAFALDMNTATNSPLVKYFSTPATNANRMRIYIRNNTNFGLVDSTGSVAIGQTNITRQLMCNLTSNTVNGIINNQLGINTTFTRSTMTFNVFALGANPRTTVVNFTKFAPQELLTITSNVTQSSQLRINQKNFFNIVY